MINLNLLLAVALGPVQSAPASTPAARPSFLEARTVFQTNCAYDPRLALAVDAVIVHQHGIGPDAKRLRPLISSWQKHGYPTGRMFFSDSDDGEIYTKGKWDGRPHPDDVERDAKGQPVLCGDRPYMVPTKGWIRYLEAMTAASIEAGADAILPEEPLAHVFSGYEASFHELWRERYGTPWEPPDRSPAAHYLGAQLKGELYAKLEGRLAELTRRKAAEQGRTIPFILPIHSAYSNLASRLVAPLGTSLSLPVDGYIGQIWTGPINWTWAQYGSENKSFFAAAYALYDYFVQLVDEPAATRHGGQVRGGRYNGTADSEVGGYSGKRLWLLTDPVEDNPRHRWADFEEWYRHCVVAELMFPQVNQYEVMPWPDRIFLPGYDMGEGTPAPAAFRIAVLSATQALQEMPMGGQWCERHGRPHPAAVTQGIGVAVADSLMWQQPPQPSMQGIYGLLLPLIQAGVPASACILERVAEPDYLSRFKVIVISYEVCQSPSAAVNEALVEWTRRGGALVILGGTPQFDGPFWWRQAGCGTGVSPVSSQAQGAHGAKSALEHLLGLLKLPPDTADADQAFGNGHVFRRTISPTRFGDPATAKAEYLAVLEKVPGSADAAGLKTPGNFCLRRGPFVVAHAITTPVELAGSFVDVFDPELTVVRDPVVKAGASGLYREVEVTSASEQRRGSAPQVLHTTHRLMAEEFKDGVSRVVIRGPAETPAVVRLHAAGRTAEAVSARNSTGKDAAVDVHPDAASGTLRLRFPNDPHGVTLQIRW